LEGINQKIHERKGFLKVQWNKDKKGKGRIVRKGEIMGKCFEGNLGWEKGICIHNG
jgi:hypothetical protein